MTATWPAGLPQYVLRDGHEEAPYLPRASAEPDAGPPIGIRLGTVDMEELACGLWLTGAQLSILKSFVFSDLAGGVLPFDGPHPRTRDTVMLWFIDKPKPYRARPKGGDNWIASFTLRALIPPEGI